MDYKKDNRTKVRVCLIVGAWIIFIALVHSNSNDNTKQDTKEAARARYAANIPDQPDKSSEKRMEISAWYATKNYVEAGLVAPSTADFPFLDFTSTPVGDSTYVVRSYVDAQNGFGAQIRTHFVAKIQWNGRNKDDNNNWAVLSLNTY